ncbi:hypothetical protein, partial [Mesorhizobium sp. M4A.F.Ca.ET.020.02.1.1]|uniref:hypothetical protein n=4 Tax=unclassified Mesorhizobium TaxID=325217 RepID=UPI001AECDC31
AGADTKMGTADDAFTFTLLDQIDHTPLATGGGDAETIALSLASVFVATDGDGDSVVIDAGASVTIENDVPQNNAATVNVNVDEDELTGLSTGITDNDATTTVAAFTGAQIAGLVNAGADEPVTVSLNPLIDNVDTGLDSKGSSILFDFVDATHVNGVADGRTVFTLVQTAGADTKLGTADDAFTFTLLDQIDHTPLATGGGDAETIALSLASVFAATDFDGDSVVIDAGASVTIENDVPTIGLISDGLVDFAAGSSVTKTLSGVVGADEPATYSITSSPATVTILDGTSSQVTLLRDLTNSNTVATYFKDVDSSGTHNAGDIDFFKLTLSGGNYTFDVLENPPPAEVNFSFAGAPSGSNLFMTFGNPASTQIVVIGKDPLDQSAGGNITTKDVLNISQAGSTTSFGVNGNQINPGEGAFITYVTGANTNFLVPNLDQNEADVEANIAFTNVVNASSASFTVNQTNPGVGPVSVKISALNTAAEPGVNFVNGLTGDTAVTITSVSVVDNIVKTGNTQFLPTVTDNGDGTWTIKGLSTGDKVQWTTSGTHDRVLIENVSNADGVSGNDNNTFDIGGFGLSQAQPAPDEKLDFTVQIADFDGDTASDSFSIGIDGTGIFDDNHVDGVVIA